VSWVWIVGNGVALGCSFTCLAWLYKGYAHARLPLVSVVLFTAICFTTAIGLASPEFVGLMSRNPEALRAGEFWRLVTPLFVQPGGAVQALMNACLFLAFVPLAERLYGRGGVLALFFVAGIGGQLVNHVWLPEGGGTSTAIFGCAGAVLAWFMREKRTVPIVYLALAVAGLIAAAVLGGFRDGHGPAMLVGALIALFLKTERAHVPAQPGFNISPAGRETPSR
jgi:rhomboid protease GluP